MEQLLIKKIAEKYGVDYEEAKTMFESLKKEDDDFKKLLSELTDSLQVLSELPDPAKNVLTPVIQTHLLNRMGASDDIDDMFKKVTAYTAMLKAVMGKEDDEKVEKLERELKELKELLLSAKEAQREEEMDRLWHELQDLKRAIIEAKKPKEEENDKKDDIDQLEEILTKIEATKEKMKKLGLLKEAEDNGIDIRQAEELLKKAGYRVEPPPDWMSVQRIIQEELKRREEELRKRLEEELGIQERKMGMLMDFAMAVLEGVIGASTSGGGNKVSEFMGKVKQLLGGGTGGGEQSTSGEG